MLKINVYLERKPTELRPPECHVTKLIELPEKEFAALAADPYVDRDFIAENRDLMGQWDGTYHCLLVLGEGGNDGILIEAEGAGYVRYGAYVSHARDFVERELERIAELFLKDISPDPETGDISIYLEDIEEYTGTEVRDDSEIARMFYRVLQEHPAVAGVEAVGDCLVVTPAAAQTHNYISEHQQELIDRVLGYFGEYHNSQELYDILHGPLEMSHEDIESLGFDISDCYEIEEESQSNETMMEPTM